MSNPSGPDQPDEATDEADTQQAEAVTDAEHEPATEILLSPEAEAQLPAEETTQPAERRFTAPSGFDAGSTQKIDTPADPATEVVALGPVLLPVAALAAAGFVLHERRTPDPVLPLRALRPAGA